MIITIIMIFINCHYILGNWLVVLTIWKIWKSMGRITFHILWKIKHVWNHQPDGIVAICGHNMSQLLYSRPAKLQEIQQDQQELRWTLKFDHQKMPNDLVAIPPWALGLTCAPLAFSLMPRAKALLRARPLWKISLQKQWICHPCGTAGWNVNTLKKIRTHVLSG